jgi:AraC-like DNA-binding protein
MPTRVVVYDPDGLLPVSFASDAALGDGIVHLDQAADVHRIGRVATVHVLVPGRDTSAAVGFLASSREECNGDLVLFAADARRHRRLIIRAARHGATLLIGQTPSMLAACLRDLIVPHPLSREAACMCRGAAGCLSSPAFDLLLVAADRAAPETRAHDIARALGISRRTLSRRVGPTELRSVTELLAWGRLLRALVLTDARTTRQVQARVGGFRSVRAFERTRQRLLGSTAHDAQPALTVSSVANALLARRGCTAGADAVVASRRARGAIRLEA